MKPTLKLLQTPRQRGTASFDRSRPAPQTDALREAWWAGQASGYRTGWVGGVRWGIVCGSCTSLCLAGILGAIAARFGLL